MWNGNMPREWEFVVGNRHTIHVFANTNLVSNLGHSNFPDSCVCVCIWCYFSLCTGEFAWRHIEKKMSGNVTFIILFFHRWFPYFLIFSEHFLSMIYAMHVFLWYNITKSVKIEYRYNERCSFEENSIFFVSILPHPCLLIKKTAHSTNYWFMWLIYSILVACILKLI